MTPDELETRAQQIHAVRHRAGTASVCGSCRRRAAGHRPLLDRLLYPANPDPVGYAIGAVVMAVSVGVLATGSGALFTSGWFVLAAQAWFLVGPPQDRSHIPSK